MEQEVLLINDPYEFLEETAKKFRKETVVKVGEVSLTLATMSAEEESSVYLNLTADRNDNRRMIFDKVDTLSYAIKGVNGNKVKYEDIEEPLIRRKEMSKTVKEIRGLILQWHDGVINHVYEKFSELTEQSENKITKLKEIKNV